MDVLPLPTMLCAQDVAAWITSVGSLPSGLQLGVANGQGFAPSGQWSGIRSQVSRPAGGLSSQVRSVPKAKNKKVQANIFFTQNFLHNLPHIHTLLSCGKSGPRLLSEALCCKTLYSNDICYLVQL